MTIEKKTHAILGCDRSYEQSDIVLFGAPYDGTTSFRPGARFGPSAIRNESEGLESYSPYQDRDLADIRVTDGGDLDLPFGSPVPVLDRIEAYVAQILSDGKMPGMLGGEHLVTLGAIRAFAKKYDDLHILHFDAHTDLREDYLGQTLSHATVMRRCHDLLGDGRIFQFGIRSGLREEFRFAKEHLVLQKFNFSGIEDAVSALRGKPVYVSIDLDVLDPSCFPGTGTPEAGGVSFHALMLALHEISALHIVGFDLNELAPPCDPSGVSTAMACKVLREVLLFVSRETIRTVKVKPKAVKRSEPTEQSAAESGEKPVEESVEESAEEGERTPVREEK